MRLLTQGYEEYISKIADILKEKGIPVDIREVEEKEGIKNLYVEDELFKKANAILIKPSIDTQKKKDKDAAFGLGFFGGMLKH